MKNPNMQSAAILMDVGRILYIFSWTDPEGGQGVRNLLKNHKNIMFLSNTGPDPLENHKATKPPFNFGPAHSGIYLDPLSPLKKEKKSKSDPL